MKLSIIKFAGVCIAAVALGVSVGMFGIKAYLFCLVGIIGISVHNICEALQIIGEMEEDIAHVTIHIAKAQDEDDLEGLDEDRS